MRKTMLLMAVVFGLFNVFGCTQSPAPQPQPKVVMERVPVMDEAGWEIYDRFPEKHYKDQLTDQFLSQFGLKREKLTEPVRGFNRIDKNRKLSREETLPIGTEVLTHRGIVVYKWACLNKFFTPIAFVTTPVLAQEPSKPQKPGAAIAPKPSKKALSKGLGFWASVGALLSWLARAVAVIIGALLLLALIAAAVAGFIWLIRRLWQWVRSLFAPTPPPPPPPIPPVPAGPITPAPTVVPGPLPGERGIGIFTDAAGATRITVAGADGQITINNGRIVIDAQRRP